MKTWSILFLTILVFPSLSWKPENRIPKPKERISNIKPFLQTPQSYIIHRAQHPLIIDGLAKESDWREAKWSSYFVDIQGSSQPKPPYKTRVKMLWDNENLYLYAELEEPHIWGTLDKHDEIIFHDNDFEVFISNQEFAQEYFELEINTLGTIFDLLLTRPYRNGGKAIIDWDIKGLQSAVHIEGTHNDPTDRDKFWAVEIAIPLKSLSLSHKNVIPEDGNLWRINFSRVQWKHDVVGGKYQKRRNETGRYLPEENWVWSPQGVINMHFPERWGYLQFSSLPPSEGKDLTFKLPEKETVKQITWLLYYLQKEYYSKNNSYSTSTSDLINQHPELTSFIKQVRIETRAEKDWFSIMVIKEGTDYTYRIDNSGILSPIPPVAI